MTEEKMGRVSKEEVAEELFAAIKDCFVGKANLNGCKIELALLSGETFAIFVQESN
ncbi:MAG: hypothetical protein IJY62_06665 [Clostridia bacterium]|nr:hypothetical protein [Clostridia bacterium]